MGARAGRPAGAGCLVRRRGRPVGRGTAFRLWAIRTLKSNFAATVRSSPGSSSSPAAPYRWLRHPRYTGAWLAMVGAALLMHSYLGLVLMGPGMLLVYMRRMRWRNAPWSRPSARRTRT
ncbi:MAG: hypothetical protein IPM46_00015 [Flavobacteriales bacterium]|nr:hypothetical protein [Flavobacteriales bacterium]